MASSTARARAARVARAAAAALLIAAALSNATFADGAAPRPAHWVAAYYSTWNEQYMPPGEIEFAGLTEVMQAFVLPKPDGTVEGITAAQSKQLIDLAHSAGCKVVVSMGGENSGPSFTPNLSDTMRPVLVRNLVALVVSRQYDGVDIDMEPIQDSDISGYTRFITELRAGLNAARPGLLLTTAVGWQPKLFAALQSQFDQINVMTYCESGPWQGWSTWHNAALYGASSPMSSGAPYPSDDAEIQSYLKAGVSASKLGLGIPFFGEVWSGATAPKQSVQGVTMAETDYHEIVNDYAPRAQAHWDTEADAPYLSLIAENQFVSYDDARSCADKVTYALRRGLGGVMIWEIAGGYMALQPRGHRQDLLKAVVAAAEKP
jgi:chitinase